MSEFLAKYPKIEYNINNGNQRFPVYQTATNIFFRTRFLDKIRNNTSAFYKYYVRDQDTPESVAFKYYGNPEYYWIILQTNDMQHPFYDWPLSTKNFTAFMKEKYGSVATAKTTINHYNKIIEATDSLSGITTTTRYRVDYDDARTNEGTDLPYDSYSTLAEAYYPNISGNFADNSAVTLVIKKEAVYAYDYEYDLNEAKREISIIHERYLESILAEFKNLTNPTAFFRDIRNF